MDNQKMGNFICEMRKAQKMTQKELAQKLNITDKAVSKWERGLSYPDIALLPKLAETLDVTVSELLDGEKKSAMAEMEEEKIECALQYADKTAENKVRSLKILFADAFSLLLLLGILVCSICDLAVSGNFTWSLISDSSILLAWAVGYPVIRYGQRGIWVALTAMTILLIPFLYVLDFEIRFCDLLLPIGIRMALIAIGYAWIIYGLFLVFRKRKYLAGAVVAVLCIPVQLLINYCLSLYIFEPFVDEGDVLSFLVMAVVAAVLWRIDHNMRTIGRNEREKMI